MIDLGIWGVWTMEVIISAIIGATAGIVVAVIGAAGSTRKSDKKVKDQLTQHDTDIKGATKDIQTAIKNESSAIATANAALNFLRDEKNKELGAQEHLNADRKTIVDNTRKLVTEFEKVVAENAALAKTNEAHLAEIKNQQQQVQQLRDEVVKLKTYLKSQQADRDYEPEL